MRGGAFLNGKEGRVGFRKRDTTSRFLRYPPQTGEMTPSLVPSGAYESRWRNAYKEQKENINTIFPIHLRFYQKAKNQRHDYMKHLYQYLRLFLWRILDAIDRKLGPGPGDHRP